MTSSKTIHDLLIVGGGINGTGIAVDAAGRGLNVVLCEMSDLASATSSASTKLIHGGLRYLEQYEFRLVREALSEREVLLRKAPHIIWPMRFQLPHRKHLRPRWMIRAGLYLYDFLGHRVTLPRSQAITFDEQSPLVEELKNGFEYSDAWVDDARLVILNAMQARSLGAEVLTRTRCEELVMEDRLWKATLVNQLDGGSRTVYAKTLVNAAGPWVGSFAADLLGHTRPHTVRLVKGCHIIVPRLYQHPEAFLLQNSDGRVVFVIPYEQDYTLIGTTEEECAGDPGKAKISDWEIDYLISLVNECFRSKISRSDMLHNFCGVRPLIGSDEVNASKVSRDYTLEFNDEQAPALTVYGGKITTYRKLAEAAMNKLETVFPGLAEPWTEDVPLPGGDFVSVPVLRTELQQKAPWLAGDIVERWIKLYGSLVFKIIGQSAGPAEMGRDFGHGLFAREVDYLVDDEWALTAEDILWPGTG
jgi:glycerol-3-phosphate dehydrogenase